MSRSCDWTKVAKEDGRRGWEAGESYAARGLSRERESVSGSCVVQPMVVEEGKWPELDQPVSVIASN